MSLQVTKSEDTRYTVVLREKLEYVHGGGTIKLAELPTTLLELKEGAPVYFNPSTGYIHLCKTADVQANLAAAATALRVQKNHAFIVGDFITNGSVSTAITAIVTTETAYDTLTLTAALSSVLVTASGTILYQGATETTNAATAAEATVEDIVDATLTVSDPRGLLNGITVTISQNGSDALAVAYVIASNTITIALADTTPANNTAALCQAAIRALAVIEGFDFTAIECTAAGTWDAAAVGGVLTDASDVMVDGVASADCPAKYSANGILVGNHNVTQTTEANVGASVCVRGSLNESLAYYDFGDKVKSQLTSRFIFT